MRATSQSGDGLFQQAAAAVLLFEAAGPNPAMDLLRVTGIVLIPFSIIAPFMGVLIDRLDRRRILLVTPIVRASIAGLLALTALGESSALFLLAVLMILSLNRFFLATLSAVLPQLVAREDLVVANASSSTAGAGANVSGQAIGALVAEWLGGRATAALAGVAFALGGGIAGSLPVHRGLVMEPAPWREELRRVMSEMKEGFYEMANAPRVAAGMRAIGLLQFLVGVLVAILLHFLVGELGLGPSSGFAMLAVLAVGVGAGVLVVPFLVERLGSSRTVRLAFVIGALGCALPISSLNRGLMSIAAGMVGIAYALVKVPVDTIVQEDIDDAARGRAFSVYDMLFNGTRIVGTAFSAVAYQLGVGTRVQTAVAGVGFLVVGIQTRIPNVVRQDANMLPTGALVHLTSSDGAHAADMPELLHIDGRSYSFELLWRGRLTSRGIEKRVLGIRLGSQGLRLVADPNTGSWEVTDTWTT